MLKYTECGRCASKDRIICVGANPPLMLANSLNDRSCPFRTNTTLPIGIFNQLAETTYYASTDGNPVCARTRSRGGQVRVLRTAGPRATRKRTRMRTSRCRSRRRAPRNTKRWMKKFKTSSRHLLAKIRAIHGTWYT